MAEFGAVPTTVESESQPDKLWADFNALKLPDAAEEGGEGEQGDGEGTAGAEELLGAQEGGEEEGEEAEEEPQNKKPDWKEEQENKLKSIISSRRKSLNPGLAAQPSASPAKPARIRKSKSTAGVKHHHPHSSPIQSDRTKSRKPRSDRRPSLSPSASRRDVTGSRSRRELSPLGAEGGPRRRRSSVGVNQEDSLPKPDNIRKAKSTGVDHQRRRPSLSPSASRTDAGWSRSRRELSPHGRDEGINVGQKDQSSSTLAKPARVRKAKSTGVDRRLSLSPSASRRDMGWSRSRRELSPHGGEEGAPRRRERSMDRHTRTHSATPTSRPTRRPSHSKGSSSKSPKAMSRSAQGSSTRKTPRRAKSMDDSSTLVYSRQTPPQIPPERQQRITDRRNKQHMMKQNASLRKLMADESLKAIGTDAPATCILDDDESQISWSRGATKPNQMDKSQKSSPKEALDGSTKRELLRKAMSSKNQSSRRNLHARSRSMDLSGPQVSVDTTRPKKRPESSRRNNYKRSLSMDMSAPGGILDDISIDTMDISIDTTVASADSHKKQPQPRAATNRRDMLHKSMSEKPSWSMDHSSGADVWVGHHAHSSKSTAKGSREAGKAKPKPTSGDDQELTLPVGSQLHSSSDQGNNDTSRTKLGITSLAGDELNMSVISKRNLTSALMDDTSARIEDLVAPAIPQDSSLQKSRSMGNSKTHNNNSSYANISRTKLGIESLANNVSKTNVDAGGADAHHHHRHHHHHHNKARSDKHLRASEGSASPHHDGRPRRARRNSKQRSLRNLDLRASTGRDDARSKSPINKHRSSRDLGFRSSTGPSL